MIYLIYNRLKNTCKIGTSNNPEKRLIDLQVSNDDQLELLFTKEGSFLEEKLLHEKYKDNLIRGEWFNYVPEMSIDFNGCEIDIHYSITYLSAISLLDDLDKVSIKVLFYCNMYCQWETNMISLTKGILKDMEEKIGLKYQTIRNSIVKLKKLGVFIDLGGATYRINPKYYWKGSSNSRVKTMKYVLEIECPECN